jgi:hypothetical protein
MKEMAKSDTVQSVEEAIHQCHCAVINENIVDVTYLQERARSDPGVDIELPKASALSRSLLAAGYKYLDKTKRWKIQGKPRTIVAKPSMTSEDVLAVLRSFEYPDSVF